MEGKVVSYLASKKYGFISGNDGESYFFHFSHLRNQLDEKKLIKGVVVKFDPVPSPKGLAAQSISVPEVYFQTTPVNFLMSKHKNPRVGQVEARYTISTRFFDDPKEGREHIKQLAIEIGCNAVLNLSFEKDTFSSGNYRYTVHAFTGDLALVTEKTPCNSKELEASSQQAVINTVVRVRSRTFIDQLS